MQPTQDNGIISVLSHHSVDQTVDRVQRMLVERGVHLFALIDHSGEALKVGLEMRPTKLLIFGSPKAGTPLMIASPTTAIDLPLKLLVREDGDGKVWISFNDPHYLKDRHGLASDLLPNIAVVASIAERVAQRNDAPALRPSDAGSERG